MMHSQVAARGQGDARHAGGGEAATRNMAAPRAASPRRPISTQSARHPLDVNMRPTMSVEIPLVQEIEKHECLYNFHLPEYNRKDTLEEAWLDVAQKLKLTVYECKDKWKNIRSSFLRSLKFSGKLKKPYYLSNYLQFILPYLKPSSASLECINSEEIQLQPAMNNDSIEFDTGITIKAERDSDTEQMIEDPIDTVEENPEPVSPETTDRFEVARKRRYVQSSSRQYPGFHKNKNKRLQTPRTEYNAMKYFLLSLLPEFNTMDEEQVRLFKIKVMMLIDDIKTGSAKSRKELRFQGEDDRLQKRLVNLLIRNLKKD